MGLPKCVIDDARGRLNSESASFEETIEKLENQRRLLENDREELQQKLRQAQEAAKKSEQLKRELTVRLEMADEKARRDAERILEDARRTAERTFDELDEMKKRRSKELDHKRENEARAQLRRQLNEADERLGRQVQEVREQKKSARPPKVGDTVELLSMGVKASVLDIAEDGTLSLQAGILKVSAREDEVYVLENQSVEKPKIASGSTVALRSVSTSPELDIRGMMTDEAIPVVERYIDSACMNKLQSVSIIHGKGTGALRAAVSQSLKTNKAVKSFRLGKYGEGESGVTIVELR